MRLSGAPALSPLPVETIRAKRGILSAPTDERKAEVEALIREESAACFKNLPPSGPSMCHIVHVDACTGRVGYACRNGEEPWRPQEYSLPAP